MQHNLYKPQCPELKKTVIFFWQVNRVNDFFRHETIIPKGIVEIIFNFYEGEKIGAFIDSRSVVLPRCFVNGYNVHPINLNLASRQLFFGIAFHPTAIKQVLGVPAGEFANEAIDMTTVDHAFNTLWHQLAELNSFHQRVHYFSCWLEKRLIRLSMQEQAFNRFLTDWSFNTASVSKAADELCYSPRHLSRKMREHTGMNIEQTLLYKKYLQAVHLMHHSNLPLSAIAHTCSFYDQPHFIKTFKSFTQLTPNEYKNIKSHVPGHIYGNVR